MTTYIHILTSLESGGAQRVFLSFVSGTKKDRHIVYYLKGQNFFSSELQELGAEVQRIHGISSVLSAIKSAKSGGPTIIGWMYHACIFTVLFWLFGKGEKIIWSIHHGRLSPGDSLSAKFAARICALISSCVPAHIIYPSEASKIENQAVGFASGKNTHVVYNPVDDKYFRPPSSNRDVISFGFSGRNHPGKRYDMFLEAAMNACDYNKDVKVYIAGKGTNSNVVTNLINMRNLQENFHLYGQVSDLEEFYDRVSYFVSVSETETFGLTAVEAYARGCNIICSDIRAFREVLPVRGVTFLADPSVASLTELLITKSEEIPVSNDIKQVEVYTQRSFLSSFMNVINGELG